MTALERHPVFGLSVPEQGGVPAPRYAPPRRRLLFRACGWLQERVLDRELGTGYLVRARRAG